VEYLPTLELLRKTHDFPGPYTFKVIGSVEDGFIARAVVAVRQSIGGEVDPPYSLRVTEGGRHVAITLTPMIFRPEQILTVYRSLKGLAGLVMIF
jgi:putative lipoic acid-binding regulatory protein